MSELSKLPNVGKVLEENLQKIGVTSPEELKKLGAKEAFTRITLTVDSGACLHMLYGIQGAIDGIQDKFLSTETKQDLKTFYNTLKGA